MKPSVEHDDFVIPGFTLYYEGNHSVFLEPLKECVHRASNLLGHTVTRQIATLTIIIIQADFMQVDHQLA